MMPTEAVQLAEYIRAHFPSQPIAEYTSEALAEVLEPYPLDDCRAAVLALATRTHEGDAGRTKWCSPTDVQAEVRRIRARRIDNHPPLIPPSGLTEAEERAWIGEARRRVGDGEHVEGRGQLVQRHMPELRALIARGPKTIEESDV